MVMLRIDLSQEALCPLLGPHLFNDFRIGPDKYQSGIDTALCKSGVLCQESISRMDRITISTEGSFYQT